jgi:signal transduction histidine kinase
MAVIKPLNGVATRLNIGRQGVVHDVPSGRRRTQFHHTIRFRLTIWYVAVMAGIVLVIGAMVSTYVQEGLSTDMENRLEQAAEQINSATRADVQVPGRVFTGTASDTPQLAEIIPKPPEIANLVLSGIWVTYTNKDGSQSFKTASPGLSGDATARSGDGSAETNLDASPAGVFPGALFDQVDTTATLQDGTQVFQTIDSGELHARVLVYPIIRVDNTGSTPVSQVIGSIIVGTPLDQLRATMDLVNRVLLVIGVGGVVVALFFSWVVAGRALSPVQKITGTAQVISREANSSESLAMRLDVPNTSDELEVLASTFNTMLSRIEDSFNAQRRFVADASHELRTPLTAIRGNVDVLLRQAKTGRAVPAEELNESLRDVQNESDRMARLIADLLTLARSDASRTMESVHPEVVSLDVLAMEAYRTLHWRVRPGCCCRPIPRSRSVAMATGWSR